MKARKASEIKLSSEEMETLERYVRRRKTGRSMAQRAEITRLSRWALGLRQEGRYGTVSVCNLA